MSLYLRIWGILLYVLKWNFADVKCLEYIDKFSYFEIGINRKSDIDALIRYLAVKEIEVASLRRWVDASWRYVIAALLLSVPAFFLQKAALRRGKVVFCGGIAAVLLIILTCCALDRNLAFSAKLLFKPYENPENPKFQWLKENESYFFSGGSTLDPAERYYKLVCSKELIIYSEPDKKSEEVFVFQPGYEIRGSDLIQLYIDDKPGWKYGKDIYCSHEVYDEKGLPHFKHSGYIRIEDIVSSCGIGSGNGINEIFARQSATMFDVLSYRRGIAVSPSIMYAFIPFELYLLCPLTAAALICWLALLIYKRIRKV